MCYSYITRLECTHSLMWLLYSRITQGLSAIKRVSRALIVLPFPLSILNWLGADTVLVAFVIWCGDHVSVCLTENLRQHVIADGFDLFLNHLVSLKISSHAIVIGRLLVGNLWTLERNCSRDTTRSRCSMVGLLSCFRLWIVNLTNLTQALDELLRLLLWSTSVTFRLCKQASCHLILENLLPV